MLLAAEEVEDIRAVSGMLKGMASHPDLQVTDKARHYLEMVANFGMGSPWRGRAGRGPGMIG